LKDLGIDGRIFRERGGMVYTGFEWLRVEFSSRLLWTRWWTSGFCERWVNFLTSSMTISLSRGTLLHGVNKFKNEYSSLNSVGSRISLCLVWLTKKLCMEVIYAVFTVHRKKSYPHMHVPLKSLHPRFTRKRGVTSPRESESESIEGGTSIEVSSQI
jgi:hypothetical protein